MRIGCVGRAARDGGAAAAAAATLAGDAFFAGAAASAFDLPFDFFVADFDFAAGLVFAAIGRLRYQSPATLDEPEHAQSGSNMVGPTRMKPSFRLLASLLAAAALAGCAGGAPPGFSS